MSAIGHSLMVEHTKAMFEGVDKTFRKVLLAESAIGQLHDALGAIDLENVSPASRDIFGFARYCELDDIKCVIIGQDPYPDKRHAHGLSFSSLDAKVPASLISVYDCIAQSGHLPADWKVRAKAMGRPADLGTWAKQGVLMINLALTTVPGKAGQHLSIWAPYVKKIIAMIGAIDRPMAFMLWGGKAQAIKKLITNPRALVLEATHPSPLSQNSLPEAQKFKYCTHFTATNAYLAQSGLAQIDWNPWRVPATVAPIATAPEVKESVVTQPASAQPPVKIIFYTDGSASENGSTSGKAGYATWFTSGPLMGVKLTGRLAPVRFTMPNGSDKILFPTNIRAEGYAIAAGLERVIKHGAANGLPIVEVVTDSKFWISMITTFIPSWLRSHVHFSTKENPDLVKRMWAAVEGVRAIGELELRHVYSHGKDKNISQADREGNDICDRWATEARLATDFFDKEELIE